jgi:hypothetical protein
VATTDKALGAPYVTDAPLVGVVVTRVTLAAVVRGAAVLAVLRIALGWGLPAPRRRLRRA